MNTLNREEKAQVIADVVERLERTSTVVTADFRGLSVAELAELRGKLREADAEMTVVKNTLTRRAADQTGHSALLPYLTGPTGLVWVNGDPASAAKALSDFAKAHDATFSMRGGMLDGADLDESSLKTLASLPSKGVLLAQLAGGIAAPLTGLAGGLQSLISTMARTLSAVASSGRLGASESPAETPARGSVTEAPAEAPAAEAAEAPVEASATETTSEAPADEVAEATAAEDVPSGDTTIDEAAPAAEDPPAEPVAEGDAGDGEAETPES